MATTESLTEAALFARVASLSLSPAMPIAWPNVSFDPPASGYLRITHIPNTNRRMFIGSAGPHQRLGLLQVDVFVPLDQGGSAATELAGLVAAHFPADHRLTTGSPAQVVGRVVKAPDLAGAMRDSPFWMVPVTIAYEVLK